MSSRLKAIDFILSEKQKCGQTFLPFVNERGPMGDLLKQSNTQRSKHTSYHLEPLLTPKKFKPLKSNVDPLMYLMDQKDKNKIKPSQAIMLNSLLQRHEKQLGFQLNLNQHFVKSIPISEKEEVSLITYPDVMTTKMTYLQIIQTKKKDPLTLHQPIESLPSNHHLASKSIDASTKNQSISRSLSPRFIERICLRDNKQNIHDNSLDFLNYSIDIIKPKTIVNVHITETRRKSMHSQKNSPISQNTNTLPQKKIVSKKQQNETDNMFQRMILDINKQVKQEQLRNQNNFLIPNKLLNYKELSGNFAHENYQKMRISLKKVQEYRGNLYKLSKNMEDIVNYRRYGGVRDSEEDDLIRQGKFVML